MYVCMICVYCVCMYVCVHAYFVGKMKSTNIIPYNGLIFEEGIFTFHKLTIICKKFPSKYLLLAFTNMPLRILEDDTNPSERLLLCLHCEL